MFIYALVMILCVSSVSSVTFHTDQVSNEENYFSSSKGNVIINDIVGSRSTRADAENDTKYFQETTDGGFYFDYGYELEEVREDFYLTMNNIRENASLTFYYRGDTTKDPTLYVQELILREKGRYIFRFEPDYVDEPVVIYINASDEFVGVSRYIEEKPGSFSQLMQTFVEGFEGIIDINIALWRTVYYVFLLIVTSGFVFLIFYIAFKVFEFAKNIKNKEGFYSSYIHSNSKKDKE